MSRAGLRQLAVGALFCVIVAGLSGCDDTSGQVFDTISLAFSIVEVWL